MSSISSRPSRTRSTALLGLLACLASACAGKPADPPAGPPALACTTEAKMCPDGSGVGRTGPNCEFAPCPAAPAGADAPAPAPAPDAAAPTP